MRFSLTILMVGVFACSDAHGSDDVDEVGPSAMERDAGDDAHSSVQDSSFDAIQPEPVDSGPALDSAPDADSGSDEVPCILGTAVPCECPDGLGGYAYCNDDRRFGVCECPLPPGPGGSDAGPQEGDGSVPVDAAVDAEISIPDGGEQACTDDPEWCDGFDNDCDTRVDEGHVCPDSTVSNTMPYTGGVWLRTLEADDARSLRRLEPDFSGPTTLANRHVHSIFRPSDGAIFYSHGPIYRFVSERDPIEMPTPPCFGSAAERFGFDSRDRFYYRCGSSIRRDNGERVANDIRFDFHDVFASGRFLGTRIPSARTSVGLFDTDGTELSRAPIEGWVGSQLRFSSALVEGDTAFVVFTRRYRNNTRIEAVVFRVDADTTEWSLVRRVPIRSGQTSYLALPDGRLYETWFGRDGGGVTRVTVYPVEGAPQLLLRVVQSEDGYRAESLMRGPRGLTRTPTSMGVARRLF